MKWRVGLAVLLLALPAHASSNEVRLRETLQKLGHLLERFEENAASYHIRLRGGQAAQRVAAQRMVSTALRLQDTDPDTAWFLLGFASSFPDDTWYRTVLTVPQYVTVLDARDALPSRLSALPHDSPEHKLPVSRSPYIQPNQTVVDDEGKPATVLDFVHFPPETYEVTVRANGLEVGRGTVSPGATELRVQPSLGTYDVEARLARTVVHQTYRAATIHPADTGLIVNGSNVPLRMAQVATTSNCSATEAEKILRSLKAEGITVALVECPNAEFLRAAARMEMGVALLSATEPSASIADFAGALGTEMARYAEEAALWMWAISPTQFSAPGMADAACLVIASLDPYERPVLLLGAQEGPELASDYQLGGVPLPGNRIVQEVATYLETAAEGFAGTLVRQTALVQE